MLKKSKLLQDFATWTYDDVKDAIYEDYEELLKEKSNCEYEQHKCEQQAESYDKSAGYYFVGGQSTFIDGSGFSQAATNWAKWVGRYGNAIKAVEDAFPQYKKRKDDEIKKEYKKLKEKERKYKIILTIVSFVIAAAIAIVFMIWVKSKSIHSVYIIAAYCIALFRENGPIRGFDSYFKKIYMIRISIDVGMLVLGLVALICCLL